MSHHLKFTEDDVQDGYDPNSLEVFRNDKNQLYLQMGTDDFEPGGMQWMVLGLEDTKVLIRELTRIAAEMEAEENPKPRKQIPQSATKIEPQPAKVANGELFKEVKPGGAKVRRFINGQRVEDEK